MPPTTQTPLADTTHRTRTAAILAALGVIGILGGIPINAELVGQAAPDQPLGLVLAGMIIQLGIMVALAILAFSTLGRRMGLDAPAIRAYTGGSSAWARLAPSFPSAVGLAGHDAAPVTE